MFFDEGPPDIVQHVERVRENQEFTQGVALEALELRRLPAKLSFGIEIGHFVGVIDVHDFWAVILASVVDISLRKRL